MGNKRAVKKNEGGTRQGLERNSVQTKERKKPKGGIGRKEFSLYFGQSEDGAVGKKEQEKEVKRGWGGETVLGLVSVV